MIIISQNLSNFDFSLPPDAIFRINLAWVNHIDELKSLLDKNLEHKIFLDLPVGRTKPPNNKYSFDDISIILNSYKNIKYFAISNVNSKKDLEPYVQSIPQHITLVPKIESPEGVRNIEEIVDFLGDKKTVMLDHDDLFTNTLKEDQTPLEFKQYFTQLVTYCNNHNVELLRTIGVVFSDQEKRVTEYVQ